MQLTDIRTAVRYRVGIDDQDAMVTDGVLNSFINASLREVANIRDWSWYEDKKEIGVAASTDNLGTNPFGPTYKARGIKQVRVRDDYRVLRQVSPNYGQKYRDYEGDPLYWYIEDNMVFVVPVVKELTYFDVVFMVPETELASASDEPLIPDHAIDLVIIKSALKVAARLDNTSQMQLLEREERDVLEALADDARRSKGPILLERRTDWSM